MKFAIIFSCLLSAGMFSAYSVVMGQVKNLEDFYGNMDKYAQTAVSSNNSVENPHIPQSVQNVRQPLKETPLESLSN